MGPRCYIGVYVIYMILILWYLFIYLFILFICLDISLKGELPMLTKILKGKKRKS